MCLAGVVVSFVHYIYYLCVWPVSWWVLFTIVMCLAGVVVSFVHYSYVFGRCRGVVVSFVHYSYVFGRCQCRSEFCSL